MDTYDVLIVGGGPAGSSCAWRLRHAGLKVALLDRATFPRNKVCGGWITPSVVERLEIDLDDYSRSRVLQPITAFRTGSIGGTPVDTDFGTTVSYGIRRREFDDYLFQRCGARVVPPTPLSSLRREGDHWIANEQIGASVIVGAGGHFCPVARLLGARPLGEAAVVAQETEFEMTPEQISGCSVRGDTPELYFCRDIKGYGWCFRKQNFLNVGLGRMDSHRLSSHVEDFLAFLRATGRISFDIPAPLGHAYLLYGPATRHVHQDGALLAGDAAGLAFPQSGEGILPAIESGLLAGECIAAAQGNYSREHLEEYWTRLDLRFGDPGNHWMTAIGQRLPSPLTGWMGRRLLEAPWFARDVVLKRWFLHAEIPVGGGLAHLA